jgi:hypothetical protein
MDGTSQLVVMTSNRVRSYSPAIASKLRGTIETLSEPAQDVSNMAVGKSYCCVQCNFNLGALDSVISEITRIAAALEAVTGHYVKNSISMYCPYSKCVSATPQPP